MKTWQKNFLIAWLAVLVACGSFVTAEAGGPGQIAGIVDQEVRRFFGGTISAASATTGQALVRQSDGTWAGGTVAPSPHNVLSATHGDTTAASLVSGDILYVNGSNKLVRLAKGSDGQTLTLASGIPAWTAAATDVPAPKRARGYVDVGGQLISNNTTTAVVFNASRYDNDTILNTSTGIFTCKTAGVYLAHATIDFDQSAVGYRELYVLKNNAEAGGAYQTCAGASGVTSGITLNATTVVLLAVNDTLKATVYQNSTGNLNVLANDAHSYMELVRLGPQ